MGPGLRIHALHQMSDGSILGAGWTKDLRWVPTGVRVAELVPGPIDSKDTSGQGVVVRWSGGLDTILWVAAFPKGTVGPLRRIRSSELPGSTTGMLFISGDRTVSDPPRDGYFLAKIQGHLDRGSLPSIVWTRDVACPPRRAGGYQGSSQYKTVQAWDVDNSGRVFLARGAEADYDSAEVVRLDVGGGLDLVAEFRSHVTTKGRVWRGSPSDFDSRTGWGDTLLYSRLFLKSTDAQGPRSNRRFLVTAGVANPMGEDSSGRWTVDSAGGLRRGNHPLDILFPGPCREYYSDAGVLFPDSVRCPTGRGWSGLSASSRATARIGGIVVDRRTNRWALGVTWNALGQDGSSLDMPVVSVYESEGKLLWWSRLRSDADRDTVPNSVLASLSEIQSLAVGQTERTTGQTLVVQAHARSAESFWNPERGRLGPGWRQGMDGLQGTGAEGAWLGKLTLVNGGFLAATWQVAADANSGGTRLGAFFGGWPVPGSPGERLASTRCHARVGTDDAGPVQTICQGARPLTTAGAFQAVPAPDATGASDWNVLTVWTSALDQPKWATAFDGERSAGDSGIAVEIADHIPLADGGALVVGHVRRSKVHVAAVDPPAWADTLGDVVVGRLSLPSKVGVEGSATRRYTPELAYLGRKLRLEAPGEGDGYCRWIEVSGRKGSVVPLQDGKALLDPPRGVGIGILEVRRGGRGWMLRVPILR